MTDAPLLAAVELSFRYPGAQAGDALSNLSLEIRAGEVLGLLGPNGAGKTTLLRCACGLFSPRAGRVHLAGRPVNRDTLALVGTAFENPGFYPRLTDREYLHFFAALYRVEGAEARVAELAAQFGYSLSDRPAGKLSAGQRQVLQLLRSLLHRPRLVLWDEPFAHLDPVSQRRLSQLLVDYVRAEKAAAILATHHLEEAEAPCGRFAFLAGGVVRALTEKPSGDAMQIAFAHPVRTDALPAWIGDRFLASRLADGQGLRLSGPGLAEAMPEVIRALVGVGLPVAAAGPVTGALYDWYRRHVDE